MKTKLVIAALGILAMFSILHGAGTTVAGTRVINGDLTVKGTCTGCGGGGAGMVLLESHACSGASCDFTTRNATGQSGNTFQTDYDIYRLEIRNLVPAGNDVLWGRVSTDSGMNWIASSTPYGYGHHVVTFAAALAGDGSGAANQIQMQYFTGSGDNVSTTASAGGLNAFYQIYNPLSTAASKLILGEGTHAAAAPGTYNWRMGGAFFTTGTSVNAFRLLFSGNNITSGTALMYGLAK